MSGTMNVMSSATSTGAGSTFEMRVDGKTTVQVYGSTSSGAGSATVQIEVCNSESSWIVAGTVVLTLGTSVSSDGFTIDARWSKIRGNVTALSGTGANISVAITG